MIQNSPRKTGSITRASEDPDMTIPKIDMVDLKSQYQDIREEVHEAFDQILTSAAYINGPYVKSFQADLEKYLGANHVIPCGNGTDALQVALMALELKPGDEVIVPAFTFVASVEVIALMGLVPVLVDVDDRTFNMDINQLEAAVGERTKAIMPVHLFGQCADMESILSFAQKHNLFIIEDNAQSIGADYTFSNGKTVKSGTMGDIGCLSFYPSKNLGCYGDGGAIMSQSEELGSAVRSIVNHGMAQAKYYHDRVGVNSRLDSFQAAVLQIKLKRLDKYIATRQAAAAYYDNHLGELDDLVLPARDPKSSHVFHQYTIRVRGDHRDVLKQHLADEGIPTMIYYPVPTEDQNAFKQHIRKPVSMDRTRTLCTDVLSLPMHSELDEGQLEYICSGIKGFFSK